MMYVYIYICVYISIHIYIHTYIHTDKAALWAIGSSGVVFEWVENSMWFEGFSGKAGAESGDAESAR